MKRLIFAFCALAVVASAAFADVPDATKCSSSLDSTNRLLIVPNTPTAYGGAAFTLTIRNSLNNPINNCLVEVLIAGLTDSKTHLCGGVTTVTGTTNLSGVVSFNIGGGGCFKGANACVIRGNGTEVRNYSAVVSPDYAGTDNVGVAGRWSVSVGLADFSSFSTAYTAGVASCHDYDNGGSMGLADFSVFGACYNKTCTP
jgi:hypothetical protein